jgi:DNA primase
MAGLDAFIEKLREKVSIAELVGRDVRLQKRGKTHLGLCPFHNEKTPSFTVDESKGFYHCFGCGAHGDVFAYMMHRTHMPFMDAVKELANQVGMALPQTTTVAEPHTALYALSHKAMGWFTQQLERAVGEKARAYLVSRGVSTQSITHFNIGFAPDQNRGLFSYLLSQGFSERDIIQAGLAILPEDGRDPYDRFRGRLMFPILDAKGRVIAFGGRVLSSGGQPKYLNSPETPIFNKSHTLYGADRALVARGREAPWLVVEGYLDVILLHQYGYGGAVAPLGTALSEHHLEWLWKRGAEPILCFDGDDAGLHAAERALRRALPFINAEKRLRFALLPAGEDPASLLVQGGAEAFQRVLEQTSTLKDFLWQSLSRDFDPHGTPEDKLALKERIKDVCKLIADKDLRQLYWQALMVFYDAITRQRPSTPPHRGEVAVAPRAASRRVPAPKKNERGEKILLATLINHPTLVADVAEYLLGVQFSNKRFQDVAQHIVESGAQSTQALQEGLRQAGFTQELQFICDKHTLLMAPFVDEKSSTEEAREGWLSVWHRVVHQKQLAVDRKESRQDLKKGFTTQNWDRLKSLLTEK